MSSDNYHTIRQDESGSWRIYHGFMSNLEDGFPAERPQSPEFTTEEEASSFYWSQPQGFMENYYSEYGLILEPEASELLETRLNYFRQWPEDLAEEWNAPYRAEAEAAGIRAIDPEKV